MSECTKENNYVVWCDIPVADLKRACNFYQEVLNTEVNMMTHEDMELGIFMHQKGNGACLTLSPNQVTASGGILIYLNVNGRIDGAVQKTIQLGGEIIEEVHLIGEWGHRAIILDSEGNRIALHSSG
ncbi:MAG: VOC family protein [Gammaproteobacteria bacterium]|nr:VOC family protein [Gammaproteobacteria bacterium]